MWCLSLSLLILGYVTSFQLWRQSWTRQIKYLELYTRGVNRSPKILDLRKCPNPIRNSVGHLIFSWKVFRVINYSKFHAFFDPMGTGCTNQWTVLQCTYIYLCTSVTIRQHLACRKHFLDVISIDEYWDNFGRQNILDIFGHFWLALDFGLRGYEKCPDLTLLLYINQFWARIQKLRRHDSASSEKALCSRGRSKAAI